MREVLINRVATCGTNGWHPAPIKKHLRNLQLPRDPDNLPFVNSRGFVIQVSSGYQRHYLLVDRKMG